MYEAGEIKEYTFTTTKIPQSKPDLPVLSGRTATTITVQKYENYEYSLDGINWQTSNVFTNLTPDTRYYICQRKAETSIYQASEASDSIGVRTAKE